MVRFVENFFSGREHFRVMIGNRYSRAAISQPWLTYSPIHAKAQGNESVPHLFLQLIRLRNG